MRPPELPGILSRADVAQTGAAIVAAQERDGALPWPDGHTDAWNHIESAMGLLVSGEREAAEHAYAWLRSHQRPDGSWATSYIDDEGHRRRRREQPGRLRRRRHLAPLADDRRPRLRRR